MNAITTQADHWCRKVMNDATQKIVKDLKPEKLEVLEISGNAWHKFGFKSYDLVNYPDFDICTNFLNKKYDLIIAEQVFEHIRRPIPAAKNVLEMLKDGGSFIITTPFLLRYHPSPLDLWRWTPDGLRVFLEESGFSVIESTGWGNKECVQANLESWADYNPSTHSLHNDDKFPVVVWAHAKKLR